MIKAFLFIVAASVSSSSFAMSLICRNDQGVPRFNLQINQNPNEQPLGLIRTDAGPYANVTCGNVMNNVMQNRDSICSGVYANDSDPQVTPRVYFETPVSITISQSAGAWLASLTLPVYFGGAQAEAYCQLYR
jgi:hypothetical protein